MSESPFAGELEHRDEGGIDWETPRWRESDAKQGEVEREHRLRDDPSPSEHGAIDRAGSIGGPKKRGMGQQR